MSGQNKIIETILDDAKKQGAEIVQKAEAASNEFINTAKTEADKEALSIASGSVEQALELKRRQMSVAQLEGRKAMLSAKREVIDEAFKAAHEALINLDSAAYLKLIERLVLENAADGDELMIADKDAGLFTSEFMDSLNDKLKGAGKSGVALCSARADISGGIVFRGKAMERNCSLEQLLKMVRAEAEPQVAAILFE